MKKIKIKDIELNLNEEQIKDLKEQLEDKKEIEHNTRYWCVNDSAEKYESFWADDDIDDYRRNIGNFYLTEEDCDKAVKKQHALAEVLKYIRENDLEEKDMGKFWEYVWYDKYTNSIDKTYRGSGLFYLSPIPRLKENTAKQLIDNQKDNLLVLFNRD